MTVNNVQELKKKLSNLNIRKQIEIGKTDRIRVLDYYGKQKYLFLMSAAYDTERVDFGFYHFAITEKPIVESSGSKISFHYQRGKGVQVINTK